MDFSDWHRFKNDGWIIATLGYVLLWPLRALMVGRGKVHLSSIQPVGANYCRIDDKGVRLATKGFAGSWSWRKIRKVTETEQLFIFDITTDRKIAIPKRVLMPVDDARDYIAMRLDG